MNIWGSPRRLLLVCGLYNAETKAPTHSFWDGNCWFTKGNIFRGLPRPMWSRRSTLTFSWNMLGCVQIQPLCSLSLIWANTRWYWSIPSFPTEHRGVWGSREVSYRQPQKGLEEPSRQGNHSDQLLMLPELMGLYIVASAGFLWGKYHVQTSKHNSLNTTKVNSYLIQSIRIESHLVLRIAAPLPPPLQVVQEPVRASLLCKEVFTLQDNMVKKPCCLAQALNFSL